MPLNSQNAKWLEENEATVIDHLVQNHSPADLADLIIHNEKWCDQAIEKIRKSIEKREGLLEKEKLSRKKLAEIAGPTREVESKEEAELRLRKKKQREQKSMEERKVEEKANPDDFLPDDDFEVKGDDDAFEGF